MKRLKAMGHDPFQEWLLNELDSRGWTMARLARELDVFKGTVGRWLVPHDGESKPMRPNIESFRRLGELFAVDPIALMKLAGIEGLDLDGGDLSPIKRDVIAAVVSIPDDLLLTVYPQLRGLMDRHVQNAIRQGKHRVGVDEPAARRDHQTVAAPDPAGRAGR